MTHSISLQNVGAISKAVIPISETGGVTVFKGRNGCGKSTGLETISTLASGRGKLPPLRDGEKAGLVSGFGSKIDLRLSGSRRGGNKPELVVDSIEGKFSISDLVNPNIKDPKAADNARLKALITLIGVDATPDLFATLFPTKEEFDKNVSKSSVDTTDPILMAERVKRDIEEKARIEEEKARRAFAEHDAMIVGTDFEPGDIIDDMTSFYCTLDEANQRLGKLQADREAYEKVMRNIDQAKRSIETVDVAAKEKQRDVETNIIGHRNSEIKEREIRQNDLMLRIRDLEKQAEYEVDQVRELHAANLISDRIVASIQNELSSLDGYKKIVEQSETVKPVPDEDIAHARDALDTLRTKMDKSAIAKENKRKKDSATELLKRAESIRDNAQHLRSAARQCDVILTDLIGADSKLRIADGRMVVDTGRGETFYADLSDGERWKAAFEVVSQHVRKTPEKIAVITIPQVGWESLDPTNQKLVVELSKLYRINTITAEATDGDLTVEQIS